MYYCLTEYNTIHTQRHHPYYNKKENYYFILDYDYDTGKSIDVKLKIFSEDIFDLIEIDDLVELDMNENMPTIVHKYEQYDLEAMRDLQIVDRYCIAIYKPNENGDYIKVWRKDNEMEHTKNLS